MKSINRNLIVVILGLLMTTTFAEDDFDHKGMFDKNDLNENMALSGMQFYLPTVFGPTGMNGWILDDMMVVREVDNDSPADGVMLANDAIVAVNGKPLGSDPLRTFGASIEGAETTGVLKLGIIRNGKNMNIDLKIRKLGAHGKEWPFDCAKSRQIHRDACDYLVAQQNTDGLFDGETYLGFGLNGLTWLAAGDVKYLEPARRLAYGYRKYFDPDSLGTDNWGWGYMGTFLAEYYLRTGDTSVLPLCSEVCKAIENGQQPCGAWGHGPTPNPGYTQGGILNNAGLGCFQALILFREAGVDVDEEKFQKAYNFFNRFVYRGAIPYGDHRVGGGSGSNGKQGSGGICFSLLGEEAKSQWFARSCSDGYLNQDKGHTGSFMGFFLGNIQGSRTPHYPDYRRQLDHWQSTLNVMRRWDGGFLSPLSIIGKIYTYRGPLLSTGAYSLLYAVPDKQIRILGKPKGLFSRQNHSAAMQKAIGYYQDAEFEKMEQALATVTEAEADELRLFAKQKTEDLQLTVAKAEEALSVTRQHDLVDVLFSQIRRYTRGTAKGLSHNFDWRRKGPVNAGDYYRAKALYNKYKWLTYTSADARKAFEEIALMPGSSEYGELARRELATPPEDSHWAFYCELMHFRRAGNWQTDELARAAKIRVANIHGGSWPRVVALTALQNAGILGNQLKDWTSLFASPGIKYPNPKGTWRICTEGRIQTRDKDFQQPAWALIDKDLKGWTRLDYDDSFWFEGKGPQGAKEDLNLPWGTKRVRIAFNCEDVNFDQLMICVRVDGPTVGYLNGTPVLWAFPSTGSRMGTSGLTMIRMPESAIKLLKEGRNVFAAHLTGAGKGATNFDFALYGNQGQDPLAFKPRPKEWRPGLKMATPGSMRTATYVARPDLTPKCTTGLAYNVPGKPNDQMDYLLGRMKQFIGGAKGGRMTPRMIAEREAKGDAGPQPNPNCFPIEVRAQYLGHPNKSVREGAASSLAREGEKAMPYLLKALESSDVRVAWAGCRAMAGSYGMNGGAGGMMQLTPEMAKQFAPKLAKLLDNEDMYVRSEALKAFAQLGRAAVPYFDKISKLASEKDWWVREGVAHVFNYTHAPEAAEYAQTLIDMYKTEKSYFGIRRFTESITSIAKTSEKGAQALADGFVPFFDHESPEFRALNALTQVGPKANTPTIMAFIDETIAYYEKNLPTLKLKKDIDNYNYFIKSMKDAKYALDSASAPAGYFDEKKGK